MCYIGIMEYQAKLHTERTILTPLQLTDFDEILEMYNEPGTAKFILPLLNRDRTFYVQFLTGKIESNKTQVGFWTVRNAANNAFIGTANLNKFQHKEITHVGCHLSRSYWGCGYGFEIMNHLKDYGIEKRGMTEVYGLVEEGHEASKHLMKKMGFVLKEQLELDVMLNVFCFRPG